VLTTVSVLTLLFGSNGDRVSNMANFWENDEVVELVVQPEVTVEAPKAETTGTNFWDKDTVVGLIDLATTPQEPAPVSEDPDRQFFQSGVEIEDRFPETPLSDTIADESAAPLSEVDPARRDDEEFLRTGKLPEFTVDEEETSAPTASLRPKTRPAETAPQADVELFDKIVGGESDDYDTVYYKSKIKPPKPITEMTVGEVRAWQDRSVAAGSKSSAAGRFQIIRKTMDSLINRGVLSSDDVFDETTQRRAYEALLDGRGFSKIKSQIQSATSEKDKVALAKRLQNNLAMEFASIPVATSIKKGSYGKWPKTDLVPGDTFYKDPANPNLNKAQHKVEDFLNILTRL